LGATQSLDSAVGEVFSGPRAAIARFLNQLTYFEMKNRAGIVERGQGADVLPQLAVAAQVRLRLVRHSFGARLRGRHDASTSRCHPGEHNLSPSPRQTPSRHKQKSRSLRLLCYGLRSTARRG
jgi:hypothetical protein